MCAKRVTNQAFNSAILEVLQQRLTAHLTVSDPHAARLNERDDKHDSKRDAKREDKRSFLQKLAEFIHPGPDSKDELIETLAEAEDNDIINAQSRFMLEGVIRMADMTEIGRASCRERVSSPV